MSGLGRLQLDKAAILEGLQRLDAMAKTAGVVVDMAIYGGAALSMKCMAMRPDGIEGSLDISDIESLAEIAQVADVREALDLVQAFYPAGQVPAKVHFGVEEIMARVQARRGLSSVLSVEKSGEFE